MHQADSESQRQLRSTNRLTDLAWFLLATSVPVSAMQNIVGPLSCDWVEVREFRRQPFTVLV